MRPTQVPRLRGSAVLIRRPLRISRPEPSLRLFKKSGVRPLTHSLAVCATTLAVAGALLSGVEKAGAATLYWDADGNDGNNVLSPVAGLGGAGIWDTTSSLWWTGSALQPWSNGALDTAVFTGTAGAVSLGSGISVGGLRFDTTGYTITGASALTIEPAVSTDGITVQVGASGTVGITAPIVLGADQTWTVADTGAVLSVSGGVGGVGRSLTKLGNGVLELGGTNSYTGQTAVNGGILRAGAANALAGGSALVLGAAGTVQLNGFSNAVPSLAGVAGGVVENGHASTAATLTVGSGNQDTTFGGTLRNGGTGTLGLTKVGTGRLILSGVSSQLSGNVTVSGGILESTGTFANGTLTAGVGNSTVGGTARGILSVSSGTYASNTISLSNGASGVGVLLVSGGGVSTTATATDQGITGNAGSSAVVLTNGSISTRRMDFNSSTATATGSVRVTGGTLSTSEYLLLRMPRVEITMTGGTVARSGASQGLSFGFSTSNVVSGNLNLLGGTINNSSARVLIAGIPTVGINLNGGVLQTLDIFKQVAAGTGVVNLNGGTLRASNAGTILADTNGLVSYVNGPFGAFAGGAVFDTNGLAVTASANLLAPTGDGVSGLTLGAAGSGYISPPIVEISGGGGTGAAGYAEVDLNPDSPTYGQLTGVVLTNPGVGYTSTPSVALFGGGGTGAGVTANGTVANTSGGLTKVGAGTLTLSGTSTFTGPVRLNAGVLAVATLNDVGVAGPLGMGDNTDAATRAASLVLNGGSLSYTGAAPLTTTRPFTLTELGGGLQSDHATAANALTIGSATPIVFSGTGARTLTLGGANTGANTFAVNLSDTGSGALGLAKAGAGTWTVTGANTFTGPVRLDGGVLAVESLNDVGVAGPLGMGDNTDAATRAASLVLNGGTLSYTGAAPVTTTRPFTLSQLGGGIQSNNATAANALTIGSATPIVYSGTGARTLTLGGTNTGANTFAAGLTDAGSSVVSLAKAGTGSWTLSGANTYTGNTTVSGGTLNITGTLVGNPASSVLSYGSSAGTSVVNVSNDMTLFSTTGGNANGAVAVYNQTAGTVNVTGNTSAAIYLANAAGSYGYFNLTGGTYKTANRFALGLGTVGSASAAYIGGTGVLDMKGAEWLLNYSRASFTVADSGVVDRTGATNFFGLIMNSTVSGGVRGVLNMAGGSFLTPTFPIRLGNSTTAGAGNNNTAMINLGAGVLQVGAAISTSLPADGANNAYLNFAGGTLQTSAGITNWIPASSGAITFTPTIFGPVDNSAAPGAPSFSGGLTVDTNGFNSSFNTAFLGASGAGVTQANLVVSGGSGYAGAPEVVFSTAGLVAGGTPAAGYARISNGVVTGIVITSPGTYTPGTVPTVTLTGGGGTGASVTVSALNTANTSGGLNKNGTGTLTLSGNSTFTGPVRINGGVLAVTTLNNVGVAGPLGAGDNTDAATQAASLVLNGGALSYTGAAPLTTTRPFTLTELGGGIQSDHATAANALTIGSATPIVYSGTGARILTLGGANTGANTFAVNLSDTGSGALGLAKAGVGTWNLTGSSTFTGPVRLDAGVLAVESINDVGVAGPLGAGNNTDAATRAASLVFNGGALSYTGSVPATTTRPWTLTELGGGIQSNNATAANALTIGSATPIVYTGTGARTLTLGGVNTGANTFAVNLSDSGSGALGLVKAGAGTWSVTGANTFTGPVRLDAGVLAVESINDVGVAGPLGAGDNTDAATRAASLVFNGGTLSYTGAAPATTTRPWTLSQLGGGIQSNHATAANALTIGSATPIVYSGTGARTLTLGGVNTGGNTFAAGLTDAASGVVSLAKTGAGTWTISGTHTYTGSTTLTAGKLGLTGSLTSGTGNTLVGSAASSRAVLDISGGGQLTTNRLSVGASSNSAGAVYFSGASLTTTEADGTNLSMVVGGAAGAYGAFSMSGGNVTVKRLTLGGSVVANATAVFSQAGGTFTSNGWSVIGQSGGGQNVLMDLSGGTYVAAPTGNLGFAFNHGSTGYSVVNVRGTATLDRQATGSANTIGLMQGNTSSTGNIGILNLLSGGTIKTIAGGIVNGAGTGSSGNLALLNLNGGTIVTSAASSTLINVIANAAHTAVSGAYVYGGGVTVDTNGLNSTIPAALLAPTGVGVQSIPVTEGGSGYLSAPIIKVSGGSGVGVTAIANMVDDGLGQGTFRIGSVTVTNPGTGFSNSDVLTLSFADNASLYLTQATLGVPVFNSGNVSGGLTKTGAGTLTLSGASTFAGPVRVNGGVLAVATLNDVGVAGPLGAGDNTDAATRAASLVLNGGALSYTGAAALTTTRPFTLTELGGGIQSDNATAANTLTIGSATPIVYSGTGARTLTLGGANTGANTFAVNLSDTGSGALTLEKAGAGSWTLTGSNAYTGGVRVSGGTLVLGSASALPSGNAVTLTGGTLDIGAQDLNLGLVRLQGGTLGAVGNVGGVTSTSAYDFQSGTVNVVLRGALGLNKTGTGTVTLANGATTSPFTGPVTISGGVLQVQGQLTSFGSASALGAGTGDNAGSLILDGGTLAFTGSGTNTIDRLFTLTSNGGRIENNNGVAGNRLLWASTAPLAFTGTGNRTLTLGGSNPATAFSTEASRFDLQVTDAPGGTVALTKSGASQWSLTNPSNSYTGGTTLEAGLLGFVPGALGSTGPVTFSGTGVLFWNGVNTTDLSSRIVINQGATATFHTNSNDVTFASPFTYSGGTGSSLTKTGLGTLTLTALSGDAAANYSGTTTINGGGVVIPGPVALAGGLTFGTSGGSTTVGTLDVSAGGATFGGPLLVQTNNVSPNTILVGPGRTVTVNGNVTLGTNTDGGTAHLVVTGGGAFAVNGASMVVGNNTVGTNNSSKATLDLTGVSNFQATLSGSLTIQQQGDNGVNDLARLLLSNTANTIRAAAIQVGASATGAGGGASTPNQLVLGAGTNVLQTDLIHLGSGSRDSGQILFSGASGSVSLRNAAGTGRANVTLGVASAQTTSATTLNTVDVTGHAADLAIGTLTTSPGQKTAANTNLFLFNQGTLDILNVNLGVQTGAGLSTNRISIGGGTVLLGGSSAFGDSGTGSVVLATAAGGELEITGGTVTTSVDITRAGAGTALITLNGGVLEMAGKNIGTASNAVLIGGGGGVLRNVAEINGGTGITLGATGRALILGGTNTYSGTTTVAAGGAVSFATVSAKSPNSPLTAGTGTGVALGVKTGDAAYFGASDVDSLYAGTFGGVTLGTGALVGIDTSAGDFTYGSSIPATALGLAKVGPGVLTLTGTNAYTGDTRVFGGTLVATRPEALGDAASALILEAGTELRLASDTSILPHNTTVRGNASIFSGRATSGAGITHTLGTLSLGAAPLSIRPDTNVAADSAYGLTFGATTLSGNATLDVANNGTGSGTLRLDTVGGGFGITKIGNGVLELTGTSTYSGPTEANAGVLRLGAGASLNAATALILGTGTGVSTLDLNGATTGAASVTFGGAGSGPASQGILEIGTGGTLNLGGNIATVATGNTIATHRIQGGTLDIGAVTRTVTVEDSTGTGTELEISSVISGSGGLTKAGAGTLRLSGDNTFTGNVSAGSGAVSHGPLVISRSGALGIGPKTVTIVGGNAPDSTALHLDGSAGPVVVPANISFTTSSTTGLGGIVNLAGDNSILGNFTLQSGGGNTQFTVQAGSLTLGSATSTLIPNTTGRNVVLNGPGNGFVAGSLQNGTGSNTLGLFKQGAGEWTLSNANTYTAGTSLFEGALRLAGGNDRLSTSGRVVLGSATNNTSGRLILGGDPDGAGNSAAVNQTLIQSSSTGILATAGTGTSNSVVGGHLGAGTSAGNAAGNSVLTVQVDAGFTNTYGGLFGWDGTGSLGAQNNLNVVKSGAGVLELSADLSRWTGTITGAGPNLTSLAADPTRPELVVSGGSLRLASTSVINTVIRNTGGVVDNQGATFGNNFLLVTTGGLIALGRPTDTFGTVGLTSGSTGVAALSSAPNTAVTGYEGSQMYIGAVGARVLASSTLAAGSGAVYRLGGGAPLGRLEAVSLTGSGGYLQVAGTNVLTGANSVMVGDNGSYASGLLGARSSVEIVSSQDYTGTTTIAGGTLVVSNAAALGVPATAAGSLILDGGILRYNGITTDFSNRLTIGSGGTIDVGSQNVTFASAIGNSATGTSGLSNGGLAKNGSGTLTLTAANTYSGATTVNGGVLQVNANTGSLASGGALGFGGPGTFRFDNTGATGARSATLGALSFDAGDGSVLSQRTAAQSTTLTFAGVPTRAAGATGNFTVGGTGATAAINRVVFSSAPTAGQFLNAGLYFGGVDFAAYDAAGHVRALATTDSNASSVAAGATLGAVTGRNVFLTGAITAQTSLSIQSLKMSNVALTLGGSQTLTLSSGGLIKTGANTTISGGTLAAHDGTNPVELVVRTSASADALTISSVINAQGLTKSGAGTLTLSTSTNVLNGGLVTINGGTLSIDTAARLGGYSGVVLNGGGLTISGNSTVTGPFTLGLGGGTLAQTATTQANDVGVAGQNLLFQGLGARTLTLTGVNGRLKSFLFSIGDNGGPTSVAVAGTSDGQILRLLSTNSYTGTTTLSRGVLRVDAAGQVPGGFGSLLNPNTGAGGGNFVLAGAGTDRAVLEISSAIEGIYRSVGTGPGQIQWTGNGGFSSSSAGVTRVVNLGGNASQLTWGTGGFVPTGSSLQLSSGVANNIAAGTLDFQNPIEFGTAVRTVDVSNGTSAVDAILSGNLTFGSGGGLLKAGLGDLLVTGTNNTGAVTVDVTGGTLIFNSATAVPGATGAITVTSSATSYASIGAVGVANPLNFFGPRLAPASNGTLLLTENSADTLDFSSGNVTNMRLGGQRSSASQPVVFTGNLIPSGSIYRLGGTSVIAGADGPRSTLVLARQDILSGARSVDIAPGNVTITAPQSYSGGTGLNTTTGGSVVAVGVGSDAAFGTGTITTGGASSIYLGPVNGDRVVANRIVHAVTSGTVALVMNSDTASDGVANNTNQGAMTYLGTLDLNARTSVAPLWARGNHSVIQLGNISNSTFGISLNGAPIFSLLSDPANGGTPKTFSGTVTLADAANLVIDGDASLGTSGGLTLGTSTLQLQPGITGTVTLGSTRSVTVTADKTPTVNVPGSASLVVTAPVNSAGANTAARNFLKTGSGTLVLRGANGTYGGAASNSNTLTVRGGTLRLDSASFTAATDRFFPDASNPLPLEFGVASGTFGGASTVEVLHAADRTFGLTQGFGNVLVTNGAGTLRVDNQTASQTLSVNLGTLTRAATGGTLNFVSTTVGGTNAINTSQTNTNGILGGWATFGGVDWATQSGGTLGALATYTSPLPASGATATANYLQTASVTVTNSQTINSLKLAPTTAQTITLNSGQTLTNSSGGILLDNSLAGSQITGAGQLGATGSELIVTVNGSNSANKLTLNGVVKGAATSLTKTGNGTLVLSGANTFTGSLRIYSGVVEYSNATSGQNLGSATAAVTNIQLNGGTLRYTGSTSNTLPFGISLNAASVIDVPNAAGVLVHSSSGGIEGVVGSQFLTGLLQKTGAGTLTLGGTAANSALSVEVSGGILELGKTGVLAVGQTTNTNGVPFAAVLIGNGATARLTGTGGNQIGNASSVVVRAGGVFDVNGNAETASVSEAVDGLAGSGVVRNLGADSFTLTVGANNSSSLAPQTLGAAAAGVSSTGLNHFSGSIQDAIALTKIGSGTQVLSGSNSYLGQTTIQAGTLRLAAANVLPSGSGKGNVTLVGDASATGVALGGAATVAAPGTLDMGGYNQAINGLNSTTGGIVTNNPALTHDPAADSGAGAWGVAAAVQGAKTFTVGNNDASGAFNGSIQDGYTVAPGATASGHVGVINLVKTGAGTQTLSGASSYTGTTLVSGGVLQIQNNTGLGSIAAGTTVASGAALELSGASLAIGLESLSLSGTGIANGGALRNVSGANTYGGALTLGADSRINSDAGSLNLSNTAAVTGTFNLTVGGAADTTIAAPLNLGGLVKDGAGTLTLSGTGGTLDGALHAGGGQLRLTGTLSTASAVNVNNGGTLLLGGSNRLPDAAPVALGNASSSGTLGFLGGVSSASETLGALTLNLDSILDFGAGSGNTLTFSSIALNPNFSSLRIYNWTESTVADDPTRALQDRLVFSNYAGTLSAEQLNQITFFSDNGLTPIGGAQIMFGAGSQAELVPVPEPSTWVAGGLLLGLLGYRERRRIRTLMGQA